MQNEIKVSQPLLRDDGALVQPGWARRFVFDYNRERVRGRLKEWDYYCVLHPDYGIAITVADLGVMGLVSVVWLDLKARTFHTADAMKPFTRGRMGLPRSSERGDVRVDWPKAKVHFERRANERHLVVEVPRFRDGAPLTADLVLEQDPEADSILVATPFADKPGAFYYNHKVNCMPARGEVTIGSDRFGFSPDACMGVLDWGRGVWTYSNTWYWASASSRVGGKKIGWNLGYGFGDLSTHTENIVFVDGVGHKLDQVEFHIDSYLEPWRFSSSDGRFEMRFDPILDRSADVNLLIFRSMQHQVFGRYTGRIILDDGSSLDVDKVLGFAEEVINRW